MKTLILASTSPFRKTLLEKLNLPFICAKPNIDETARFNETAIELVERLAVEKAKAVASEYPNALIIGSDQVALSEGNILGKPHNFENGLKQLTTFSGKAVEFHTGLCVYDSSTGKSISLVELLKNTETMEPKLVGDQNEIVVKIWFTLFFFTITATVRGSPHIDYLNKKNLFVYSFLP